MNIENIKNLKLKLEEILNKIENKIDLEAFYLKYLSRNGEILELIKNIKNFTNDEKKIFGPIFNNLKIEIEFNFKLKEKSILEKKEKELIEQEKNFDVSILESELKGALHPYTILTNKIEDIFLSMGFEILDGPELETDYYNFTALNIPENHPAKNDSDTFWIDSERLLRTQTSNVQIRTMELKNPPIAIIAPGRTFRNESTDSSHDFMFMQVEGLYIDKDVSIANLIYVVKNFLKELFNKDIKLRLRPGYFPFVEPGLEIDFSCPFCENGCSICKKTKWIEIMGAGLVHPNVLKNAKIDSEIYSGFAFGFGLTRLAMLKFKIPDIRLLHSSNLNFLEQF